MVSGTPVLRRQARLEVGQRGVLKMLLVTLHTVTGTLGDEAYNRASAGIASCCRPGHRACRWGKRRFQIRKGRATTLAWAGIQFDCVADPPGTFRGDNGRSAAGKGIEYDPATFRAIPDRVGDHGDRFDCWMACQSLFPLRPKAVHPGVFPEGRAISPGFT